MGLALGTAAVVLVVLLWELLRPLLKDSLARARSAWAKRTPSSPLEGYDPGRERRAEQRARELLRSCVGAEDWEMYRDLGLLRVLAAPRRRAPGRAGALRLPDLPPQADRRLRPGDRASC